MDSYFQLNKTLSLRHILLDKHLRDYINGLFTKIV